jgi:hypothetical protein
MDGADSRLMQTRIEDRDGGPWINGLCPFCWERYDFHEPPEGTTPVVRCPEGHELRIVERHSEGDPFPAA